MEQEMTVEILSTTAQLYTESNLTMLAIGKWPSVTCCHLQYNEYLFLWLKKSNCQSALIPLSLSCLQWLQMWVWQKMSNSCGVLIHSTRWMDLCGGCNVAYVKQTQTKTDKYGVYLSQQGQHCTKKWYRPWSFHAQLLEYSKMPCRKSRTNEQWQVYCILL